MRCFLFSSRLALTLSCFGKKKLDCDLATSSHSSWNLKVPSPQPTLIDFSPYGRRPKGSASAG